MRFATLHIDGKIRAEQRAQATVDAVRPIGEFRGMIAPGVGAFGHDEDALRAEFDTEAASFASLLDNMDDAVGYLDAVSIQGLSPMCHGSSGIPH
jgi:hypothetical protein